MRANWLLAAYLSENFTLIKSSAPSLHLLCSNNTQLGLWHRGKWMIWNQATGSLGSCHTPASAVTKQKPVQCHITSVQQALLQGFQTPLDNEPSHHQSLYSLRTFSCLQADLNQACLEAIKSTQAVQQLMARWLIAKSCLVLWLASACVLSVLSQVHSSACVSFWQESMLLVLSSILLCSDLTSWIRSCRHTHWTLGRTSDFWQMNGTAVSQLLPPWVPALNLT